jgi:predicted pyridoxine 5'-phosphate oxidase superfamily flavin-nucleotide-binding protein
MPNGLTPSSDIAFSPTVKAIQTVKGSRSIYENGQWATTITQRLVDFLLPVRSLDVGTVSGDGQPYIQHRGGPPGFIRVLSETRLAFADYPGNQQYISTGNLADNPKVHLFVMDCENRRRIKIWGNAQMIEGDADLMASVSDDMPDAWPERVFVFDVAVWSANCPQHIPQRFEAADVQTALTDKDARISDLETELAALRQKQWLFDGCRDD